MDKITINFKKLLENNFLKKIKNSKNYKDLDEKIILFFIKKNLKKEEKTAKKINSYLLKFKNLNDEQIYKNIIKNKYFKELIKIIKKDLNNIFKEYNNLNVKKHKSLLEREKHKEELFNFLMNKKINYDIILDVGCGTNPLLFIDFLKKNNIKNKKYFAFDIDKKLLDILKIRYKNFKYEINSITSLKDFEIIFYKINPTIILFLKVFDDLEKVEKNLTKRIIGFIIEKRISFLVSFPKKTLNKKKLFKNYQRNWFKYFLEKQNVKYEILDTELEIYFLILF